MSLSRAFTMRSKNSRETTPPISPKRSMSKRDGKNSVNKLKISAPVQLISTTNMISYTSPSLRTSMGGNAGVETAGLGFIQESQDGNANYPPSPASSGSPPPLTPDAGPNMDDMFTPPLTPTGNHLSDYFPKRSVSQKSTSGVSTHSSTRYSALENRQMPRIRSINSINSYSSGTPSVIPEERKDTTTQEPTIFETTPQRSNSTTSNPSIPSKSTARSSVVQRSASNSSTRSVKPRHSKSHVSNPFAQELARVTELAEDFGWDLDEDCMAKKGLWKYDVGDYVMEISDVMLCPPEVGSAVAVGSSGWI